MSPVLFLLQQLLLGHIRLPIDISRFIHELAARADRVWLSCSNCRLPLLVECHSIPIVKSVGFSWFMRRRQCYVQSRSPNARPLRLRPVQATAEERRATVLALPGSSGLVGASRSKPQYVRIGALWFQNKTIELRQLEWYKVLGGSPLCLECFSDLRRTRRCWTRWQALG